MSKADSNLIACGQDHEMATILKKWDKSGSKSNIEKLREQCKHWKSLEIFSPKNRENFYEYIESRKVMDEMD